MGKGDAWTHRENLALIEARLRKISWEAIAEDTGRSPGSLRQQVQKLCRMPRYAEIAAGLIDQHTVYSKRGDVDGNIARSLIVDRDRRRALRLARELVDATATFFGDPPPGYSALDKRGGRL